MADRCRARTGATVQHLREIGRGCPDLLTGWRGVNLLAEVKTEAGQLKPAEREFFEAWPAPGPVCADPAAKMKTLSGPEPGPHVTLADIEFLYGQVWAMRAAPLSALMQTLPHLVGMTGEQARAALGLSPRPGAGRKPAGAVGILPVVGTIWPRGGFAALLGGATPERLAQRFRMLANNSQVGSIILDVDSPGGVVQGVDELAAEIAGARGKKPVIAVANHLAASAAYWLASAADEVVVSPSSESGSIGVYAVHEDFSKALEKAGIEMTLIGAGKRKLDGNPYQPLSDRARAGIAERVGDYYGMFTRRVATNRGVSLSKVLSNFGQGRVVGARDAVIRGMADRVATMDQVIAELASGKYKPRGKAGADLDFRRRRARLQAGSIDPARLKLLLAEVDPAGIPLATRAIAQGALAYVRRDLALEAVEIRWFDADRAMFSEGFFSLADQGTIWLSSAAQPGEVAATTAHEARHVWQSRTQPAWRTASEEWRELDARQYAEQFRRSTRLFYYPSGQAVFSPVR